ncbi:MAG: hypothetical protein HY747_08785 [Elusimicrobia bacterium]|nr:hypothetical protein [Elusimicrobiota bacterium]
MTLPTATIAVPMAAQFVGKSAPIYGSFTPQDVAKVELAVRDSANGFYWSSSAWQAAPSWFSASQLKTWVYDFASFNGSWNHTLTSIGFENGKIYELKARAVDSAGNVQAQPDSVLFKADAAGPEISFQEPIDGKTYNVSPTAISGTVADSLSGVWYLYLFIRDLAGSQVWDGSSWQSQYAYLQPALSGNAWSLAAPSFIIGHKYEVMVYAIDRAYNWSNKKVTFAMGNSIAPAPLNVYSGWAWTSQDHLDRQVSWQSLSDTSTIKGYLVFSQGPGDADWHLEQEVPLEIPKAIWQSASTGTVVLMRSANGNYTYTLRRFGRDWDVGSYRFYVKALSNDNVEGAPSAQTQVIHAGPMDLSLDKEIPPMVSWKGPLDAAPGYINIAVFTKPDSYMLAGKIFSNSTIVSVAIDKNNFNLASGTLNVGSTYYVQVIKKTKSGDSADTASLSRKKLSFIYKGLPPASKIVYPSSGTVLTALTGISGTASSPEGEVASVDVKIQRLSDQFYFTGTAWTAQETWLAAQQAIQQVVPIAIGAVPSAQVAAQGKNEWSFPISKSLGQDGGYRVMSRCRDMAGNFETNGPAVDFILDQTPPLTTLTLTGTEGANGFYVSQVTAALSAMDQISGLEAIYWRPGSNAAWMAWTGPLIFKEGASEIEFYAKDKAGNAESLKKADIAIDTARPVCKINQLAVEKALGESQDDFSGIALVELALKDATSNLFWNSESFSSPEPRWIAVASSGTWQFDMPKALVSGHTYELFARAKDRAGWFEDQPQKAVLIYDVTPPVSKILQPVSGVYLNTFKTVSGTASDIGIGLDKVNVQIMREADKNTLAGDGWTKEPVWLEAQGKEAWKLEIATSLAFAEGRYLLFSRARDLYGNQEADPGPLGFFIDPNPPATTLTAAGKLGENDFYVSSLDLILSSSDTLSGPAKTVFRLNSDSWRIYSGTITLSSGAGHLIEYYSTDLAGNEEARKSRSFKIDTEAPVLEISYPANAAEVTGNGSLEITGKAQDSVSGLAGLTAVIGKKGEERTRDLVIEMKDSGAWRILAEGLDDGQFYKVSVAAKDMAGLVSRAETTFKILYPKGQAKAEIKIPDEGKRLRGNAVTIMAEATTNAEGVLFQYRSDNETTWKDISSKDEKLPFSVYWNVSGLANGKYYLQAVAYDRSGLPDPEPKAIWVMVDDVNADVVEDGNPSVDPNNEHRKTETVSPDKTQEVALADGTKVVVPEGSISQEDKLSIVSPAPNDVAAKLPPPESALKPAGVFREYSFESGQHVFQTPVTLVLPYKDDDNNGVIDGTDINENEAKLYYHEEKCKCWKKVSQAKTLAKPATRVSAAGYEVIVQPGKVVQAQVDHFTLFGLFAVRLPSSVDSVIAYPNPVVTSQGMNAVTFEGLPAAGKILIFSVAGRLVLEKEFGTAEQGRWVWDLTNMDGEPVASGAYLYVVSGQSGGASRGKLAVIR